MINDAEKFKADDDAHRDRVQAKNALESFAFNMKSTVEDEKLKETIIDKCNEIISWMDQNQVNHGLLI